MKVSMPLTYKNNLNTKISDIPLSHKGKIYQKKRKLTKYEH